MDGDFFGILIKGIKRVLKNEIVKFKRLEFFKIGKLFVGLIEKF